MFVFFQHVHDFRPFRNHQETVRLADLLDHFNIVLNRAFEFRYPKLALFFPSPNISKWIQEYFSTRSFSVQASFFHFECLLRYEIYDLWYIHTSELLAISFYYVASVDENSRVNNNPRVHKIVLIIYISTIDVSLFEGLQRMWKFVRNRILDNPLGLAPFSRVIMRSSSSFVAYRVALQWTQVVATPIRPKGSAWSKCGRVRNCGVGSR